MKKIVICIFLFMIGFLQFNLDVDAANYEMKELIPIDIETTIVGDKLSYKHFYYKEI